MVRFERLMQPVGDCLNRLDHLSEMHRDALRRRGGIVQLVRETGRHGSERLQLFLLSRGTFEIAKTCRHGSKDFTCQRWAEPQQKPKSFIRESDEPRVGYGAPAQDIRHTEQQPADSAPR